MQRLTVLLGMLLWCAGMAQADTSQFWENNNECTNTGFQTDVRQGYIYSVVAPDSASNCEHLGFYHSVVEPYEISRSLQGFRAEYQVVGSTQEARPFMSNITPLDGGNFPAGIAHYTASGQATAVDCTPLTTCLPHEIGFYMEGSGMGYGNYSLLSNGPNVAILNAGPGRVGADVGGSGGIFATPLPGFDWDVQGSLYADSAQIGPSPTPTPSPTWTATVTPTPTPSVTVSPTPTLTLGVLTATPTPTVTSTAATATPTPAPAPTANPDVRLFKDVVVTGMLKGSRQFADWCVASPSNSARNFCSSNAFNANAAPVERPMVVGGCVLAMVCSTNGAPAPGTYTVRFMKNRTLVPGSCVLSGDGNPARCRVNFPGSTFCYSAEDRLTVVSDPSAGPNPSAIQLKCQALHLNLDG